MIWFDVVLASLWDVSWPWCCFSCDAFGLLCLVIAVLMLLFVLCIYSGWCGLVGFCAGKRFGRLMFECVRVLGLRLLLVILGWWGFCFLVWLFRGVAPGASDSGCLGLFV